MASRFKELDSLRESNRELREALQDCHDLLERTRRLLETYQDNDPPNSN